MSNLKFGRQRDIAGSARPVLVRSLAWLTLIGSVAALFWFNSRPGEREVLSARARYEQQGKFDYRVRLIPNSLFETREQGPGQLYFARLVEGMQMTFAYDLVCDQPIESTQYNYQVTAVLSSEGMWAKSFVLVPPTIASDSFTTSFAVPIPQFVEMMDSIRDETRSGLGTPQLRIEATVRPSVRTASGMIEEPFEQVMLFTFDNDETIRATNGLEKIQAGAIEESRMEAIPGRRLLRVALLASVVLCLLFVAYASWSYVRWQRSIPAADKELQKAQKRLKGLLVRVIEIPPVREDQIAVNVYALSDLFSISEETLRPVLFCPNGHGYHYCIVDGARSVRYEYVQVADLAAPATEKSGLVNGKRDG